MFVDTKFDKTVGAKLNKNGAVLLKQIFPDSIMTSVRDGYDALDQQLTRRDIATDRPLIVFWKHVVGEQKRIGHFDEFPSLWKLIIGVGKLGSVGAGKVLPVVGGIHATRMGVQNPSAAIIVILIIAGIVGAVYYFTKNAKDRPVAKKTTVGNFRQSFVTKKKGKKVKAFLYRHLVHLGDKNRLPKDSESVSPEWPITAPPTKVYSP